MHSPLHWKDNFLRLLPHIPYLNPKPFSVTIPDDVFAIIIQFYVESALAKAKTVRQLRRMPQAFWADVAPLAKTSKRIRKIVLGIWRMAWAATDIYTSILTLGNDWEHTSLSLAGLKKLETLSIDYHQLLYYDPTSQQLQLRPGIEVFPSSLRWLEILHFHRPIDELLARVKSCCPKLVQLRLVQCTTFNNPECMWWRVHNRHPYLVGHQPEGVVRHAATLANYIKGFPHLEHFHINHYMVDLASVFRHRLDHKQHHPQGHHDCTDPFDGLRTRTHNLLHLAAQASDDAPPINPRIPLPADKALWKVHCPLCKHELEALIENAERLEASLLSAKHPSLKSVSFASFLSEGRTAPSEWIVEREYNGDRLFVWTRQLAVARARARARERCVFERLGTRWVLLGW
ncbi:unnamed protein product [Rhizoctonia solani]|uniref:Uncharacterized protein n=1 Tax=Rhizoctonia solani TaxID=456999 RepID=A0A8H3H0A0_9AGAM|nr:unnamed protein product [Rhizoctonia solani]